ncbi:hypothetical protein [Streptomyces sp. NPDC057403]|uniref:hypothetical protein n=1 Tax=Streptomyces sp. NPDC057403 TaxID=3346119 RepID=UPI0036C16A57
MTGDSPSDAADRETAERLIQSWLAEYASQGDLYAIEAADTRDRWDRVHKLTPNEVDDLESWMHTRLNVVTTETMDDHRLAAAFYSAQEDDQALARWLKSEGYR